MVGGRNAQDSGSSNMFPVGMMKEEVIEVVDPVLELLSTLITSICIREEKTSNVV